MGSVYQRLLGARTNRVRLTTDFEEATGGCSGCSRTPPTPSRAPTRLNQASQVDLSLAGLPIPKSQERARQHEAQINN
jgi:hypothetical protein